jgi:hypothetical protein
MSEAGGEGFAEFFAIAEPKLRRALVAAYGVDRGREAAAEALTYAWEHWEPPAPEPQPGRSRYTPPQHHRAQNPRSTPKTGT